MWQKAWMPVAGGCCVSAVCPSVAWLLQLIGWCLFVGDLTHHKMGRARQAHCGSPAPTVDTIFYIARINHRRQQQPTLNPFRWAATTSDRILSNVNREIFNILTPQHHFHTKIFLKCSFECGEKDGIYDDSQIGAKSWVLLGDLLLRPGVGGGRHQAPASTALFPTLVTSISSLGSWPRRNWFSQLLQRVH